MGPVLEEQVLKVLDVLRGCASLVRGAVRWPCPVRLSTGARPLFFVRLSERPHFAYGLWLGWSGGTFGLRIESVR